jgi:hypothetical protein
MDITKNLIKLSKGKKKEDTPPKKAASVKAKKVVEKKLTPEEERDLKAKEKVEELLKGVTILDEIKGDNNKNNVVPVIKEDPKDTDSMDWLSEQTSQLSEQVEALQIELQTAKDDYSKIYREYQELKNGGGFVHEVSNNIDGEYIKNNAIRLFNEIQVNYFNMIDPMTGQSTLIIYPKPFMNKLIQFFPFLIEEKKF